MNNKEAVMSVSEMLRELEHIHICMNELTESMEEMSVWLRSLKSTEKDDCNERCKKF